MEIAPQHATELAWLVRYLAAERGAASELPEDLEQADPQNLWLTFRALVNTREPAHASDEFYARQDALLRALTAEKGITQAADLLPSPADARLHLWQGDITTLEVDAIVNAANSQMLGCWAPNHACIDNAIHTFAGVQLREACAQIMAAQGHAEPTGAAKVTPGFNLPARHVIHTVGPIVSTWSGQPTAQHAAQLASCYEQCLAAADAHGLASIAFCCISTGEFHFPNAEAARIAVHTVRTYLDRTGSSLEVTFNVFKSVDYDLYRELLG